MKTATDSPRTALSLGTPLLAGAVGLWVAWLALVAPERTALVVTFASVVIVPLGLAEAAGRYTGPVTQLLDTLANYGPLLGLFTLASYTVEAGPQAALLALPWMAFTCVVGATGVARLLSRRTLRDPGVSVDCGLVFLVVGGAWLVLSRGGVAPMGFSPAIVELTAVHFHYAGFALPIVAGVVALRLEAAAYIPLAVVGGVPLTAVGITLGGVTEWIAATVMALAGLCAAALTLRLARRLTPAPGALLAVAAGALTVGMLLAIGWAWSLRFGWSYLDLDAMVSTHGFLNGFGFCLLGLIALRLSPRPAGDHGDVCLHAGRPAAARLAALHAKAEQYGTTNPIGLLGQSAPDGSRRPDGFRHKVWRHNIGHGDFDRAASGIRSWAGHGKAGVVCYPERPAIAVGETVALMIPLGPVTVSATARIIEVIDEADRYGFIYSTLPHHPQDGEESFVIHRHPDGEVEMVVTAVWRAGVVGAFVVPALTTFLQERAIAHYLLGTAEFEVVG